MVMGLLEFLTIYRYFYGTNYNTFIDLRRSRLNHLRVQSLYYLLSYFGMDVNSSSLPYSYVWLNNCAYSSRLEGYLCSINVKKEEIKEFYCFEYSDERAGLFVDSQIIRKLDCFKRSFLGEEIKSFLITINRPDVDWMKLLASIAFLKNIEMPDADFSEIVRGLKEKGVLWSQVRLNKVSLNKRAWLSLHEEGIISID